MVIFALAFMAFTHSVLAGSDGQKLFVNITSDDINKAAMAIGFSTKVRMEKKIPVTVFLNVEGARIADKNIPEHKHSTGKSLKELLKGFMQAGGKMIVCPMYMKNVGGFSKDDLTEGMVVGGSDVTWPA